MFSALASRVTRATSSVSRQARCLATHVPVPTGGSASTSSAPAFAQAKDGALRPLLDVKVNPNHGLYAFYRRKEKDGVVSYVTLEAQELREDSGRSWLAAELRRKSFKDLHTLWYVLVRERNLLATQKEQMRRSRINHAESITSKRAHVVRKSMARIKLVLNERRLAYEGAMKIRSEEEAAVAAEQEAEVEAVEGGETQAQTKPRKRDASSFAAESLFESPVEQKA
ncbi:MRP-L47-domain-containing protein [Epithele typhae]|uniref:MRP-L47-domain-containing protein n=1 Tax=Epithele typhae TaxID=378194 RepID=UPI00200772C8|nr:MRP-L47-domain-containing protein [Epithele typhae]KAH9922786.1 MRP-L47-domain-containing protein [Epithele typhae]